MIARTIFWKKFKKLIFGSFAIFFGAITCCLLGSWTNDDGIYTNATNFTDRNISLAFNGIDDFYIDETTNVYVNFGIEFDGVTIPDSFIIDKRSNFNGNIECNYLVINGLNNIETSIYDYLDISITYIYNNVNYTDYYCSSYFFHNLIDEGLLDSNTPYYHIFNIFDDTVIIPLVYNGNANYIPYFLRCEFSFNTYLMSSSAGIGANGLNNANFYVNAYTQLPNLVELPYNLYSDDVYNGLDEEYMDYMDNHSYSNTQYNDLQQQYTDYQNSHSYSNTQYNSLSQQYTDYQSSHSYSNTQYELLQTQYSLYQSSHSYTNSQYDYLSQQYNDILNLYNDLQQNYANANPYYYAFNGATEYLITSDNSYYNSDINVQLQNLNSYSQSHNVNLSISSSSYQVYGFDSYIASQEDEQGNYPFSLYYSVLIVPSNPITYTTLFKLNDRTFNYSAVALYNNGSYVSFENDFDIGFYLKVPSSTDNPIVAIRIDFYYPDYTIANISFDTSSAVDNYYYEQGKASQNDKIAELNGRINTLQLDLNQKTTQYDNLVLDYTNLQNDYNEMMSSGLGLNYSRVLWTIASTPFEAFKSIWDVEFLGFNIANFFAGIFSSLIIIWIIKKIFH